MTRFCRYELRTTDVAGASAFYARVLSQGGVTPPDGAPIATCHDPQGAIFALREC